MSFEKITKVSLPFDLRSPDPKKNYGIHGFDVTYILKGPKGAVQFSFCINVFLPHVQTEFDARGEDGRLMPNNSMIWGTDVGYHSPKPMFEGHDYMREWHKLVPSKTGNILDTKFEKSEAPAKCDLVNSDKCYYDGSTLRAEDWAKEIFSVRGERPEKLLWEKLEAEYKERFGDE